MVRLVQDFLEHTAARLPAKTAVVCGNDRFTYGEVNAMADGLAHALIGLGVRRGDRVAIHLENGIECVVSIFAALKAGGVFVVLNPSTKPDKLRQILNNCGAAILVTESRLAGDDWVQDQPGWAPSLRGRVLCGSAPGLEGGGRADVVPFETIRGAGLSGRPACVNIDLDLACLIYTSGSTGDPKGVMSDHSQVVFVSGSIIEYLGNVEDDVVLCVLPLSFDYGLYQLLMTFRFGGTLVVERSFAYPATVLKVMEQERVTGLPAVPTLFAMLLRLGLSTFDLSAVRYLTNTGAALPVAYIETLRRALPRARVFSMYGLTETKRTLYLPPEEIDRRPGSVGIPIPGTEVWVEDEFGQRCGPNRVGELVVRGRHVMRGYWGDPAASAERFRPGPIPGERLCCTGDLFRTDDDGFFYFVGRKDDIIKSRGEKVAPKEVENVLHALDGVAEAAVIGVPDPVLGQAVKAFVVRRRPELTGREVLAHCRAHLEDFMVPKHVEFKGELPRTSSGKINKTQLK